MVVMTEKWKEKWKVLSLAALTVGEKVVSRVCDSVEMLADERDLRVVFALAA